MQKKGEEENPRDKSNNFFLLLSPIPSLTLFVLPPSGTTVSLPCCERRGGGGKITVVPISQSNNKKAFPFL